jgi:hypothetical protein
MANTRKRNSLLSRQRRTQICEVNGIHICDLCVWRKGCRMEGDRGWSLSTCCFLEPNGHENIQEQLADIRKSPAIKIALKACDEVAIVIFCFHQCFSQACLEINFSKVAADIIRT